MKYVTGPEAAFIRMLANRVLLARRKAAAAGEAYHDLTAPVDLKCGHRAKLVHENLGEEHRTVAHVYPRLDRPWTMEELIELASELLCTPAVHREGTVDHLQFVAK